MKPQFYQTTLPNGLKILGEVNPANVSSAIGFFVKTGARDETVKESGVSHFLEHMMFKGTPTRSALEINLELGNLGAQANAFTSEENTVYYAVVVPEKFAAMQELLSDMLRPALDSAEFDMEKKVILEEIALYQDRPHFYLFENAFKDYFSDHTAGNSVLGSHASVSAISRDEMKSYFDKRYAPSNVTLVATGNFSWDDFVKRAEQLCSGWVDFSTNRATPPHKSTSQNKVFKRKNLNQAHLVMLSPGCSAQDGERYPLALLTSMMGDSSGSRVYWDILDKGLADSASIDSDERDGTGCIMAYVSTQPDQLESVADVMRGILATPLQFTDEDLERAKSKLVAKVVLDGELPMGRLMALGIEWNYRKESTPLRVVIDKIKAISRDDIQAAINKYPMSDWVEYRLLPEV